MGVAAKRVIESAIVFAEGIYADMMAELMQCFGQLKRVNDAASGLGGVGEEGNFQTILQNEQKEGSLELSFG